MQEHFVALATHSGTNLQLSSVNVLFPVTINSESNE